MARFFVNTDFETGSFELPDKVAHHVRVCRMRIGDALVLFNNRTQEAYAIIDSIGKKTMVHIQQIARVNKESPARIRLIQALPSMDKMDYIVQKSVELGVFEIQPIITARSMRFDSKRAEKKQQHWQEIAISACEQSGRTVIPTILPLCTLDMALHTTDTRSYRYLLNPAANQLLSKTAIENPLTALICLLIGAEGGFDESEVTHIESAGFLSAGLGPRILRTETAAPAAITICQTRVGDL